MNEMTQNNCRFGKL